MCTYTMNLHLDLQIYLNLTVQRQAILVLGPQLFVDLRHGKQWQLAVHYIDLLQDEPWAMLSGNTYYSHTTPIRIP